MTIVVPVQPVAPPPAPDRADRATFSARATASFDHLKNHSTPELWALAQAGYSNALDSQDSATTASTARDQAVQAAQQATSSPSAGGTSTTSNSIGTGSKSWVLAQTGLAFFVGQRVYAARTSDAAAQRMVGIVTAYNAGTGAITINVTQAAGAGTFTDWTIVSTSEPASPPSRKQRTITGNDTVTLADNGKILVFTGSANATLAFDAAATLTDGFYCQVQNATLFDLTLDPNASELIDGLASYPMYPNEVREIRGDATALKSVVLNGYYKVFPASGSWIKSPGYPFFDIATIGGGGGGCKQSNAAGGGGGGACNLWRAPASALGASETVLIGNGGTVATTNGGTGGTGGATTFGSVLTGFGGGGGAGNSGGGGGGANGAGNNSGVGGSPTQVVTGSNDNPGFGGGGSTNNGNGGSSVYGGAGGGSAGGGINYPGGNSIYGGGGGASTNSTTNAGTPGTSKSAGNGGAASQTANGTAGAAPGGGGGATGTGAQSGPGGRGEVRVWGIV